MKVRDFLAEKEKQTIEAVYAPILNNIISEKHVEYKIREVKTRVNQDLFRKIILSIYGNRCALSGLDYNIIISPQLKKKSQNEYFENLFGKYEKKKIILPDRFLPNKSFWEFHLNEIFKS